MPAAARRSASAHPSSSFGLLDRDDGHVRWHTPHGKSYRVSHPNGLVNLGGGGAEAHRHRGHVAGDLAVSEDQHVDLGQDGAHHALDLPLALDVASSRARHGELALQVPCPESQYRYPQPTPIRRARLIKTTARQ